MTDAQKQRIKPQTLRGFRDFLPDQMMAREQLIDIARAVYRSYGFAPIDTPALEYAEVLLEKGAKNLIGRCFASVTRANVMSPCGST